MSSPSRTDGRPDESVPELDAALKDVVEDFARHSRKNSEAIDVLVQSLVQLSGRNSRRAIMTGTSSRASVSDTRVWQFEVLPSAEAYCGATPTECVPFLGSAVSSITSTASLPPTSLSA